MDPVPPLDSDNRYWFPAKRYGWGWGLPVRWEGWLVLAGFLVLVVADVLLFPPRIHPAAFAACIVILCAALTAVCWLKGAPPHWRWGGD